MSITAVQAAEHAGLWKAARGQAPHWTKSFLSSGWTCTACPLADCEWHHDAPTDRPIDPEALEAMVLEHLQSHDLADFLDSLQRARDSIAAVKESNDRAWDVVNLHRLRAIRRGEHQTDDPAAQMLSAALVGTTEHDDVRRELTDLAEGVRGADGIASVPEERRTP